MSHVRWQQLIPVDSSSDLMVVEQAEVFYIHEGHGFLASITASINASSTGYILLKTGDQDSIYVHLRDYSIDATSAPITVAFYEGATVSNDGTPEIMRQMNRNISDAAYCSIFSAPTVSDAGSLIRTAIIPGNKQEGGFGQESAPKELVLKKSTNYLWEITNNSTGTSGIAFNLFVVET